jgi:DNA-directed RNA polymerase specialized sigma24 family protein
MRIEEIARLYDRYGDVAYSLARALTGNERAAEDVVLNAFGDAGAHPIDWNAPVLVPLLKRVRDYAARGRPSSFARACAGLPDGDRSVLELAWFANLPVRDIAREVSQPIPIVLKQLRYALDALRDTLPPRPARLDIAEVSSK